VRIRSNLSAAILLVSYISSNNKKYDNNTGPKTKPKIPKSGNPINTPITDIMGCVLAIRLLIIMRKTLSMLPINNKP
jgi:hypothetical protein